MIKFKGKEYQLRTLYIRQEVALAKQFRRFQEDDIETKADAMVEVVRLYTGIDVGDLNGSTLDEVRGVFDQIMQERAAARVSAEPEAQAEGKA